MFENHKMKISIKLSNYNEDKPIFQSFLFEDDNEGSKELMNIYNNSLKVRCTERK